MLPKKYSWKVLCLVLISAILLIITILTVPPLTPFKIGFLSLPALLVFFVLLCVFCSSLIFFLFHSLRHGVLFSLLVVSYLILRLNSLTSPLFLILLLGLFLTLEFLFAQE